MKKDLVVAFAFGVLYNILSNRQIAKIATKKAQELNADIFTQLDILIKADLKVYYLKDEVYSDCPPSTFFLAQEALKYAQKNNYNEIWVVAAQPHLKRCLRDLEYLCFRGFFESQKIHVCEEINKISEEEWFCKDSKQRKTRSKKNWERREKFLQKLPMWLYRFLSIIQ